MSDLVQRHAKGKARFRSTALFESAAVFPIDPDYDPRHRLGVSKDVLDVQIGHRFRFFTEQLATAGDRDRLRPVIRTIDELHGRSLRTRVVTIRVVLGCAFQRAGLPTRSFAQSCLDQSTLLVRRDRDFRRFAAAVGLALL